MKTEKPFASLSFDLDNQWSYMKTHGDPGWDSFPSYFDIVIPRVLSFLAERNLNITFFIVGQDAALEKNRKAIQMIVDAGHELGNHSFNHEPWLHRYSEEQIEENISGAEKAIEKIYGKKLVGFRGPGYSICPDLINILIKHGYLYDASTLPTFIGPIARLYYFMTSKLNSVEKHEREILFGTIKDGLRPIKPYRWINGIGGDLVEIPVTTMPLFKIPIHFSYILFLAMYSPLLAEIYLRVALGLCHLWNVSPSLLLHPLDFLGCEDIECLSFFPAMRLSKDKKLKLLGKFIGIFSEQYRLVSLKQFVQEISRSSTYPLTESSVDLARVM
jgi:peptidoglycan-N-acetylglucosamine deacetylase